MTRVLAVICVVLLGTVCLTATRAIAADDAPAAADAGDKPIDFVTQIKPLLHAHCGACHGQSKQEAGLRFDHRASALRGGDSGPVWLAGKSRESELVNRITSTDEFEQMPPPDEGKPLSAAQIALLSRRIDQGAKWPESDSAVLHVESDHWAYQPLAQSEPPEVSEVKWIHNPIDRFVLARLEADGIKPSPQAARHTLVRRLYYDLLGLPPTPAEVDAFVNDTSGDAYDQLVERLLASPRYGERWGRHWLDKARYADSDGYEKDRPRPNAWKYRDWVISAVNDDLPYDRFTVEQLAGDLLPNAGKEQLLATAFHRQTLTNTEGGTDQEQFRVEAVIDRVNTTSTVWLGLTVGCAQCHSHKYDQITQAEYYQLFAFFNNGDETNLELSLGEQAEAKYKTDKAAYDQKLAALDEKLAAHRQALSQELPDWERELQARLADSSDQTVKYHPLEVVSVVSKAGVVFQPQDDGSYLATGSNPAADTYTIIAKTRTPGITGLRLDALADKSLPARGPGRVAHGNFVLSQVRMYASDANQFGPQQEVHFSSASADYSQGGWDVAGALVDKPKTGWAIAQQFGKDHHAVLATAQAVNAQPADAAPRETWLKIELIQEYGSQHTIGRFKLQARTGTDTGMAIPENIKKVLAVAPEKRNKKQQQTLLDHYWSQDKQGKQLDAERAKLVKAAPSRPVMNVRVLTQRKNNPRNTHILRRGDFLQPQSQVEPDALAVLNRLEPRNEAGRPDRLDLATWLVSDVNPLTPRVAVNQVWSHLFGVGLVSTPDDFGIRGERPSHPELLDWLAREYQRLGWSRKQLIRLIVSSAVYQQSSRHRPELADVDPQNRLLARQNRFRVGAEVIRDLYLAASGLLSDKIGGPSVFPPMPADVAALSYANNFKWNTSQGEDRYRRGMYTFFKRTAPHPNLVTFDCPDANVTSVERRASNTPLQALTTLNNETFVEASQAMARRILMEADKTSAGPAEDDARLTLVFRLCVARPPSQREQTACLELLESARRYYHHHAEDAKKLVGNYLPPETSPEEAAAWVATARIVMNLDEFITRE